MTMRYIGNDRHSGMRASARLAAACVMTAMLVVLSGCTDGSYSFRYRLTVEVEVDGVVKSGSSIIEVTFYGGGNAKYHATAWYTSYAGVAPVIDLGRHGMLIAAMSVNVEEEYRRKKQFDLKCKSGTSAIDMAGVFGLAPPQMSRLRKGKRVAPDNYYPTFIWFPDGAPYRVAKQICSEEFTDVIEGHVVLRSVTMEPAPEAPLLQQLEIKAPWLDEMRAEDRAHYWSSNDLHDRYKPRRQSQIETDKAQP